MDRRFFQNLVAFACAVMVIANFSGCTTQQAYSASQEWQRNQCNRIIDNAERSRCFERANTTYEDYKRQNEALKQQ